MSDLPVMPSNVAALSPMHRTEKLLASIIEQQQQMLALLAKIEENTRQAR